MAAATAGAANAQAFMDAVAADKTDVVRAAVSANAQAVAFEDEVSAAAREARAPAACPGLTGRRTERDAHGRGPGCLRAGQAGCPTGRPERCGRLASEPLPRPGEL